MNSNLKCQTGRTTCRHYYSSALSAAENVAKYNDDLKFYMEATLIANSCNIRLRPHLLVTNDYKFWKAFVRSPHANDLLKDLVCSTLKVQDGVAVQLTGEVICGI